VSIFFLEFRDLVSFGEVATAAVIPRKIMDSHMPASILSKPFVNRWKGFWWQPVGALIAFLSSFIEWQIRNVTERGSERFDQ